LTQAVNKERREVDLVLQEAVQYRRKGVRPPLQGRASRQPVILCMRTVMLSCLLRSAIICHPNVYHSPVYRLQSNCALASHKLNHSYSHNITSRREQIKSSDYNAISIHFIFTYINLVYFFSFSAFHCLKNIRKFSSSGISLRT
jgi:hypothetical protein